MLFTNDLFGFARNLDGRRDRDAARDNLDHRGRPAAADALHLVRVHAASR